MQRWLIGVASATALVLRSTRFLVVLGGSTRDVGLCEAAHWRRNTGERDTGYLPGIAHVSIKGVELSIEVTGDKRHTRRAEKIRDRLGWENCDGEFLVGKPKGTGSWPNTIHTRPGRAKLFVHISTSVSEI